MKTKTIKLYEYSELSPEAKKKAHERWNADDFDGSGLQVHLDNLLEELLEKHGINVVRDLKGYESKYAKIYYSLSNCQGDGVMFEGVFSFPTETEKEGRQWKRYEVKVKQSGHYYHSYSKTIEIDPENEVVEKEFEAVYQKICKELEKSGYAYIEDQQSEAYFIEMCNANEYTFRADGTMENVENNEEMTVEEIPYADVYNMTNPRGNREVPNQFIIETDAGKFFKSYQSIIAFIPRRNNTKTVLDASKWDYSTTTGKYRNQFLGEGIEETRKKIKDGIYILADLNKGK